MKKLSKKSAIVVSESNEILKAVESYLTENYNFTNVATTQDGSVAQSMIVNQSFSLFVIDYNIQKINGLRLIERLNKLGHTDNKETLFLTSSLDTVQIQLSKTLEINHICETFDNVQNALYAINYLLDIIIWSKDLVSGVNSIDEDHRELYDLIHYIQANQLTREEMLTEVFPKLEHHCEHHFLDEESYMIKLNYPQFKIHQKQHRVLSKNLNVLKKSIINSKLSPSELQFNVYSLLVKWFKEHLLKEDLAFIKVLRECKTKL